MNYVLELAIYLAAGGLSLAIMATMIAAPLALITLLIDWCTGKWMTARIRCWLWLLVAVRLVLPVAPTSPVSAVNLWHLVNWSEQVVPVDHSPSNVSEFLAQNSADDSKFKGRTPEPRRSSMADVLIEGRENILPDLAAVATGANESPCCFNN